MTNFETLLTLMLLKEKVAKNIKMMLGGPRKALFGAGKAPHFRFDKSKGMPYIADKGARFTPTPASTTFKAPTQTATPRVLTKPTFKGLDKKSMGPQVAADPTSKAPSVIKAPKKPGINPPKVPGIRDPGKVSGGNVNPGKVLT